MYKKAEKFVVESFTKVGKTHQIKHFKDTVKWIKRLKPDADEALCIAAVAHDIERAFRKEDMPEKRKSVGLHSALYFRPHEERGAEIIAEFLRKENAGQKLIERVKMLVSRHEEGGNKDQNLLKDADSISFFEDNVPYFLSNTKIAEVGGKERTKAKIKWMYKRITSKKAKQIAKQWYEDAVKKLNFN